ncbi:MAG: hypothetical protein IPJ84_18215 [Bdellovibrionales bacterium]|nr:hypothetical protein [Bdellovibrionales bacterium]
MSEQKSSGLFYGLFMVAAAMAAVVIATFISTLAHASSDPVAVGASDNEFGPMKPMTALSMNCKDGAAEFGASLSLDMNGGLQPLSGVITTEKTGTCVAGRPASAFGAFGGKVDMHDFMANSGQDCRVNDASFAIFVDKNDGSIRHASLQVGEHVYPCTNN